MPRNYPVQLPTSLGYDSLKRKEKRKIKETTMNFSFGLILVAGDKHPAAERGEQLSRQLEWSELPPPSLVLYGRGTVGAIRF